MLVKRKAKPILTAESPSTGDNRFMVHIFKLPTKQSPLLVHYVGNETIFKPLPHKGSKKQPIRDFIRAAPTIGEKAKANLEKHPQQLYEELLFDSSAENQPPYMPRDRKQLENFQYAEKVRNRLSHESLYNLYELGFEYSDFVREYRVDFEAINNLVFLASKPLLEKLNQLLCPPEGAYDKLVEVFNDTTFELGRFYLSIFCFRYYMLDGNPVVPTAFMIHQRKFSVDHNNFLIYMAKLCPNLASMPFAFITDREFKDVSSIFPRATHLYCWNHLKGDVRRWASNRNHSGSQYQHRGNRTYLKDIEELLKSESLKIFEQRLLELQPEWGPKFIDYFENGLKKNMVRKACRWIVEPTGHYNCWSGITTNAIESVNAVIGRAFPSGPVKLDEAVLLLYHLTSYYYYETNRGLCNAGQSLSFGKRFQGVSARHQRYRY